MASKIKKLNKILSKYQPTIQSIGIVIILISLFIGFWQIRLLKRQVNEELRIQKLSEYPRFSIDIVSNKSNRVIDELVVSALNSEHVLNSVNLWLLNNDSLQNIQYYSDIFKTSSLKKVLKENLYISQVATENNLNYYRSPILSYPILFQFEYVADSRKLQEFVLYEYKFRVYDFESEIKILSIGFDYIKKIRKPDYLKDYLVNYSILLSDPLSGTEYKRFLKWKLLIKDDNKYSDVYDLIKSNLVFLKYQTALTNKNKDSTSLFSELPLVLLNDSAKLRKNKILDRIIDNKNLYSQDLLQRIQNTEMILREYCEKCQTVDSVLTIRDSIELYSLINRKWADSNIANLEYLADTYEIKNVPIE